MSTLVEVEELDFEYPGRRALQSLSFRLARGSVTALVGPNGAGKTTLLRCLAGLEQPPGGRIRIAGIDLAVEPRAAHAQLGYLPDHFGLYEDLSVQRCLAYAAWSRRVPADQVENRVTEVLAAVDLSDRATARAGSLSRGQRQRVALAQALIHRPALLLLDEPASGLDPDARNRFAQLVRKLAAAGMTLLVSSHILAELESYCERMLVLREGRLIEDSQARAASGIVLRLRFADPSARDTARSWLQKQPGIDNTELLDNAALRIHLTTADTRAELLAGLFSAGLAPLEFADEAERLQDRYQAAVGGTAS